jgi:hypothetical protein
VPGQLAQAAASVLERRFLLNAFVPTMVSLVALGCTVLASRSRLVSSLEAWAKLDPVAKLASVAALFAVSWLLGGLVASQWRNIIRLYEGYPAKRLYNWLDRHPSWASLPRPGLDKHLRRVEVIARDPKAGAVFYYRYPPFDEPEEVMPTQLGNILKSAERYSYHRYGADSIYLWPRLFRLLPERFSRDFEKFVQNYELPIVLSFLSGLTSFAAFLWVAVSGSWSNGSAFQLGIGILLAYLFYRLSLENAIDYGEQLKVAFDLYRHELLDNWTTNLPTSAEGMIWQEYQEFVVEGVPPDAAAAAESTTDLWTPGTRRSDGARSAPQPRAPR